MARLIGHADAALAAVLGLQALLILLPALFYLWLSRKKSPLRLGILLGALHLALAAAVAVCAAHVKDDTYCWAVLCLLNLPLTLFYRYAEGMFSMPTFFLLFGTSQYFIFGYAVGAAYTRLRARRLERTAVLLAAAAFSMYCIPAHGAGVCAHMEMGQRAWDDYLVHEDAILPGIAAFRADEDAMCAFYSGCCFPDFAYDGINQDASEYSHWYPYVNAYMEFLSAHYPPPWGKDAMKHVAFFLGHLCHNVGDWPWHFNDGADKSLTTAFVEHYGYDVDDLASDIFAHTVYRIHPNPGGRFWWPQDDAFAAFQKDRVKVTPDEIARGCVRLQGEWRLGALLGPAVYPVYQWKYRWFREHMADYYFGGIDHDAALIAQCIRYAYARLQGWRFYENISLHDILFADKKPYLPFYAAQTAIVPAPANEASRGPDAMLKVDVSDIKSPEDVHEAALWLRVVPCGSTTQEPCTVIVSASGIDTPAVAAEIGANDRRGAWRRWDLTEAVKRWASAPESNQGVIVSLKEPTSSGLLQFYGPAAFRNGNEEYGGNLIAFRPILVVK